MAMCDGCLDQRAQETDSKRVDDPRFFPHRAVDYCAECGRDLCAQHMESPGCCGQAPAKSGREAETVER
jgi:hypothetical protein